MIEYEVNILLSYLACLPPLRGTDIATFLISLLFSKLCIFLSSHSPEPSFVSFPDLLNFCPLQYLSFHLFSFMEALPQSVPSWICSAHSGCCCRATCHHTSLAFSPVLPVAFLSPPYQIQAVQALHDLPNPVSLLPLLLRGFLLPLPFSISSHPFLSTQTSSSVLAARLSSPSLRTLARLL